MKKLGYFKSSHLESTSILVRIKCQRTFLNVPYSYCVKLEREGFRRIISSTLPIFFILTIVPWSCFIFLRKNRFSFFVSYPEHKRYIVRKDVCLINYL